MILPPDQEPPGPNIRQFGCGCTLPGSGFVLLALTIVLAMLMATRNIDPLLWLVFIPLVIGIVVLFVRVRVRKRA